MVYIFYEQTTFWYFHLFLYFISILWMTPFYNTKQTISHIPPLHTLSNKAKNYLAFTLVWEYTQHPGHAPH